MWSSRQGRGTRFLCALLLGLASQGAAASTTFGGFSLPPDYLSRFGLTSVVASNYPGARGYGVRYLPFPIKADLRFSVVKRPNYWESSVYSRYSDTTIQAGLFDAGDDAQDGVPRLEVSHDPFKGLQYAAYIQDPSRLTRFSAGYALPVLNGRAHLLNNAGVAFRPELVAPFTYSQLSGGYSRDLTPKFRVSFWSTARLYTFPVQRSFEASLDVMPNVWFSPADGLEVSVYHLERFVRGSQPVTTVPDFDLVPYRETSGTASYRFKTTQDFHLNILRARVTRDWTNQRTYLYNDALFRLNALPVLVGPTIGYQWWQNDTSSNRFLFGFSTAVK